MCDNEINNDMFNDPTNISGLTSILSTNEDDKDDLDALEATIMGAVNDDVDVVEKFERSVKQYGDKLSFNLHNTSNINLPEPSNNDSDDESTNEYYTPSHNTGSQNFPESNNFGSNNSAPHNFGSSSLDNNPFAQNFPNNDSDDNMSISSASTFNQAPPPHDYGLDQERQKYENVNNVMNEIRNDNGNITERVHYDLQRHLDEDNKCRLLDEISELRTILTDEGVDLSSIPNVNMGSTDDEINVVHRILRIKNDRSRYVNLADELFITFGQFMEFMFDGKSSYLGYYPDYTDYTDEVLKNRLHRIRYDSSQIISEIVEENGLGRKSKILLEIAPSLVTYNKKRKSNKYNSRIDDGLVEDFGVD